jgi:GT2 family glycosyltransferase
MEEMAEIAGHYTRTHHRQRTVPGVLHFFCAMVPIRIWREVGELDEGFGLGMFEDDDYTLRVRAAGYKAEIAEDVFVHHHHSASFDLLPREQYEELFTTNRRYFESKWGSWKAPVYRKEMREKLGI